MKFFICNILLFIHCHVWGQDINLVVKKGELRLSNSTIAAGMMVKLAPSSKFSVNANALVLIRKNNKIIELKSNQTYSYAELDRLFGTGKGFSSIVSEIIFNQNFTNKTQSGAVVRGISSIDIWGYQPADSLRIIEDSLKIHIGIPSSKLETDIRLYKKGSTDTIKLSKTSLEFVLPRPSSGAYCWEYTIRNGMYRNKFINYFIVPEPESINILKKEIADFRNEISTFSLELQQQLMQEYAMQRGIYLSM